MNATKSQFFLISANKMRNQNALGVGGVKSEKFVLKNTLIIFRLIHLYLLIDIYILLYIYIIIVIIFIY